MNGKDAKVPSIRINPPVFAYPLSMHLPPSS